MNKFVIKGGIPLTGEVSISGSKNSAIAILPAVILSDEPCIIKNVPFISDVNICLRILTELGVVIEQISHNNYKIDPTNLKNFCVPCDIAKKIRASYYFLGALLGKCGKAIVSMPGGCSIGVRPIDQHLKAFLALGADCNFSNNIIKIKINNQLHGNLIFFKRVTVGATINAMIAAVKACGVTIIKNAAREPHIVDLANFLNAMGANIIGAGTNIIRIIGVKYLKGVIYSIIPDQIEAGTFMVAIAATKGNAIIKNIIPKHLQAIISIMKKIGVTIHQLNDSIHVIGDGKLISTNITTSPYPGFPTDMQAQISTLLTLADGTSIVTENIWDQRFGYVNELNHMGASITVNENIAYIKGTGKLIGKSVKACDLRAGAALMIAGLAADGVTIINDIFHIKRGYDSMEYKLCKIGANIEKIEKI